MTESRGAMTAQQFRPSWDKDHAKEIEELWPSEIRMRFADALSAHNTATKEAEWKAILDNACLCEFCAAKYEALSGEKHRAFQIAECQERLVQIQTFMRNAAELRQRLTDYESADLQIAEIHAKELADHEKEVAELRAALEVKGVEINLARHEASLCDDIKLDQSLEGIIADLQADRVRLWAELSRLRSQGAGQWIPDSELYALAESFFAQDGWDGAEPHVVAVAFAKEGIGRSAPVEGAGQWEAESRRILEMVSHCLRSYQYGNVEPGPAKDAADLIDKFCATGEPQTLVGRAGLASPPLEDLKLYGIHLPPCASYGSVGNETMECDCGLSAAIKRLASPPEGKKEGK